jgi:hypothetical protein
MITSAKAIPHSGVQLHACLSYTGTYTLHPVRSLLHHRKDQIKRIGAARQLPTKRRAILVDALLTQFRFQFPYPFQMEGHTVRACRIQNSSRCGAHLEIELIVACSSQNRGMINQVSTYAPSTTNTREDHPKLSLV